ncbi:MAG: GNAT family N-acetyltransferase [Bacteroidota bacterium]
MLIDYFKEIGADHFDQKGQLHYPYLDQYWTQAQRKALQIRCNHQRAGFVLLNDFVLCSSFQANYSIAEFYIKPTYRKRGIGQQAVHQLLRQYAGKWEIRVAKDNHQAQHFWRKVIYRYTQGDYLERQCEDQGIPFLLQLFAT